MVAASASDGADLFRDGALLVDRRKQKRHVETNRAYPGTKNAVSTTELPTSVAALLRRYATGRREFRGLDLEGADLRGVSLEGANLEGANLEGANLEGANLRGVSLEGANLTDAQLKLANLRAAELKGANLEGANLEGVTAFGANLQSAKLQRTRLAYADFESANLSSALVNNASASGLRLEGACAVGASFQGTKLRNANLKYANFGGVNFNKADLRGAILEHTHLEDANLESAHMARANLRDANLEGTSLVGANLERADLSRADFRSAKLLGTNLEQANLEQANLEQANLEQANLKNANLEEADLRRAILERSILEGTSFKSTRLEDANLKNARLSRTLLADVDLSSFCEARSTLNHYGPSIVDDSSILRSVRVPGLKDFLVRTGVPEVFAEYRVDCARSLKEPVFKLLRSTFISYGQPDEGFAQKLNDALFRNGVVTFFFKEHAPPGKRLHRVMREGVNKYDRVVLVCSKASLTRVGVLNEIEETLARESSEAGAECLIPIRLDDHVFSNDFADACRRLGKEDFLPALQRRVIGDFRDTDKDDVKFTSELLKLLMALKK